MVELSMIRDIVAIFGVIAGFSYYVLTVNINRKNQRQQLETRQGQFFMNLYNRMISPEMENVMKILKSSYSSSEEEWFEKYNNNIELQNAFAKYSLGWEAIGTTLKTGLINIELLAIFISTTTIAEWERYRNLVYVMRQQNRRAYDMWEYTYDTLMAYLEEHPELKPGPISMPPYNPSSNR